MAIRFEDVADYFEPGVRRIGDLIGGGATEEAIRQTKELLAAATREEIRSYVQGYLAMCAISHHAIPDGFPDPAYFAWLMDNTRDILPTANIVFHHDSQPDTSQTRLSFLLEWACLRGNSEAVKILVGLHGADPAAPLVDYRLGRILDSAAQGGCTEAVRWLLERGTPPNTEFDGKPISMGLFHAAMKGRLEICRLLVEAGAAVNALNGYGISPLDYARGSGSDETAEYLRSVGAAPSWQLRGESGPPAPPDDTLENFLGKYYDPIGNPIAVVGGPVVLLRYKADPGQVLVTSGLSAYHLDPPPIEDPESWRRVELYMDLPTDDEEENWDEPSDLAPEYAWLMEWLVRLAETLAGGGHHLLPATVLSNGEPPEPLTPGLPFTCWLLLCDPTRYTETWTRRDGTTVRLFCAIPLYTAERDFERTNGIAALLERLEEGRYPRVIDLDRPCVV